MKTKLIPAFLFLLASLPARSQLLKLGINLANVTITNDGDIDKNNMLTGFQVGFTGNVKVAPFLFFQPGILLTGKGSKTQSGDPSDFNYYRASSSPWYLEIPANFIIKSPTAPLRFFAGAGPYLAIGIAGKNKVEGKFLGTTFHSDKNIIWSNDDPSTLGYEEGSGYGIMKRFDYGLNGTAGLETKTTVFAVNYGFGLAKLQSGSNSKADDKNKHRVLSFTVGFKL